MNQSAAPPINSITINLQSFTIPPNIIVETDQLRVKAKIFPEGIKQRFDIKAKKMTNCNLIYTFNITSQTEKLHFAFRKKTILSGNQTIGTSDIKIADLMKDTSSASKSFNIYYPVERQLREQQPHGTERSNIKEKVIGQMKAIITFSEPIIDADQNNKDSKKKSKKDGQKISKSDSTHTDNLI